jgi:hypothetical protein
MELIGQQWCLSEILGRIQLVQNKMGDICPQNFAGFDTCHIGEHPVGTVHGPVGQKTGSYNNPVYLTALVG